MEASFKPSHTKSLTVRKFCKFGFVVQVSFGLSVMGCTTSPVTNVKRSISTGLELN